MNHAEYVIEVRRTLNTDISPGMATLNYALGLANEALEYLTAPIEKHDDELGDVAWYLTALADTMFPGVAIDDGGPTDASLFEAVVKVCETVKKRVFHGRQFSAEMQIDGLREVWFVLQATCLQTDFLEANVAKLRARWPDGFKK